MLCSRAKRAGSAVWGGDIYARQKERSEVLQKWVNGEMSREVARVIVGRLNREIQEISSRGVGPGSKERLGAYET